MGHSNPIIRLYGAIQLKIGPACLCLLRELFFKLIANFARCLFFGTLYGLFYLRFWKVSTDLDVPQVEPYRV